MCPVCTLDHLPEATCPTFPTPPGAAAADEADQALIGARAGGFRIIRKLGSGGMGTVYLGEHALIGSKVAVKVLHQQLTTDPGMVSRFYAEARAVNLIGHDNIVNIFDMGVLPPGRHYLVMEYLEGAPLCSLMRGPLSPEVAIPILAQICEALSAAHARGVVHRDLKPENVFLIRRERNERFVKLLDFGIAKLLGAESTSQTCAGALVGTPEFMSPEQCSSEPIDGRSDLYSLGVIAYQMATGTVPFTTAEGLVAVLSAHRSQPPRPPTEVNPAVPRAWSDVILRALAKRPADRFPDADAFRRALLCVLDKPRLTAEFQTAAGELSGRGAALDLTRGGFFLCTNLPPPPVFARLKIRLALPDEPFECEGEVVRHVSPAEARSWNMSPGFAIQFAALTAEKKTRLARLLGPSAPPRPAPPAEAVLTC